MIDHTGIAVSDFDVSRRFYDAALGRRPQRSSTVEPFERRVVLQHLAAEPRDVVRDLRRHAVVFRRTDSAFADHRAGIEDRHRPDRAQLELVLVRLHPRERRVLEDLRPLLRRGAEAEEARNLAHRALVVDLHVGEVQQQYVLRAAQRPPRRDEAK